MKRIGVLAVLALVVGSFSAVAHAAPLDPLVSRASVDMDVVGSVNGVTFFAYGGRTHSAVFGDAEALCVSGERTTVNTHVSPAVKTSVREEGCGWSTKLAGVSYRVDPLRWEGSISGSLRTKVRKETSSWDPRTHGWTSPRVQEFYSTTSIALGWHAKGIWIDPYVDGPVCLIFFVVPVPCLRPVAAGLRRAAGVTGSIAFGALGTRVTLPARDVTYPWRPSLAIWWES